MSHTSRPLKRLRDKEDSSETSPDFLKALKRSEEFWISDGNIVLVAGQTAFRVYRGLLAMQSTVFADLFASSSPTAEETYDDCPLIRLTESQQDLAHLLPLLLPTSRMLLQRRESDPQLSLHQISAIIRLAHKYHIEDLLSQALSVLHDSFPTTFNKWDDFSRIHLVDVDDGPVAVVNLARLTDTPSLLPAALYECCSLGEALVDGWKREDGTVEHLSPSDLKRCIRARDELAREAFALASIIFDPDPSDDCTTPGICATSLRNRLARIMRNGSAAGPTVLEWWGFFIRLGAQLQLNDEGYCSACEGELMARARTERERVWNRLPEIFDVEVPDWN